jgi:tape measure domain-containing protein
MADLNVQLILRLVDRATAPARAAMRTLERIGGEGLMRQAETIQRGTRMMGDGMIGVGRAAGTAAATVAAYSGTMAALAAAFVRPAAQFERFQVQLTNLEGSQEGAKRAMSWIEDFATRTPLQMEETIAAYAKLKAFGIDPTNGSMQALVDTMAASGGDVETMNGLVLAFGQAWTKDKLQGEEAMQMLERGVPVWDILAKSMGKTTAEVIKMSEKGELGREQITLLMDELGKRNDGAAAAMSQTWDGIISNLMDQWTRFQRMVMDSGLFQWMKGRLKELLDFLNAAAADGRLQAWAEQLASAIMTGLQAIWAFGTGVVAIWQRVWPVLDGVAQSIGGWDVAGWVAVFVLFNGTIRTVAGGLWMLARGAFVVVPALVGMIAPLIRIMAFVGGGVMRAALTGVTNAVLWLGRAFLIAGRFLLANPIIAVITAIAGLAYVIYQNWDGIVGYFQAKIDAVRAAFDTGLLNGVLKVLSEFNPFKLMTDAAVGLLEYLTGWDLSGIKAALYDAFAINLFDTGLAMIQSLKDGIWSVLTTMVAEIRAQLSAIVPDWMKQAWDWASGTQMGDGETTGVDTTSGYDPMGNPLRELGGPVRAGQTYMTGERGRELFTPSRDGYIVPNRALAGSRSSRAAGLSIGAINVHAAPGQSPEMIARAVRSELEAMQREARFAQHDGGAYA